MPVNMKDIARDLGVSVVTVSKALRDHPDISKATRERVLLKVKELGYRPNLTARSLVTGRSSLIGLIVPDLIHPFFADVAKGLSQALRKRGYFVVISSSEEDAQLEREEIEHMLAHRLDALVLASCQADSGPLRTIQQGETPVILLDRFFKDMPAHFVGSDDHAVGKLATEHLLAAGCQRIAHVRGPGNSVGDRRYKGYLDTLKKHGAAVDPGYVIQARSVDVEGRENGAAALKRFMELPQPPDGVFCHNDVLAMGLIGEAVRQGVRVPEDIAVIGCGNLHYVGDIRIPLSSIDQRSSEIGGRAAALILDVLASKEQASYRDIVLQPRLTARESTARKSCPSGPGSAASSRQVSR
jgi:LacI family transcriptional regulator